MNWESISIGVGACVALISFNGFVMSLIIQNAVQKALLSIGKEFVTKEHLTGHQENCPHQFEKARVNR